MVHLISSANAQNSNSDYALLSQVDNGWTELHIAARKCDHEAVLRLIATGKCLLRMPMYGSRSLHSILPLR